MRAVQIVSLDGPSAVEVADVPQPEPGPDQVLIRVRAAGVSFPEVLQSRGQYQFKPDLPFSPGGEVSGVVSSVGPDVGRLVEGDRVVCSVGWGGMAERVVVDETSAIEVPPGVDMTAAAASSSPTVRRTTH